MVVICIALLVGVGFWAASRNPALNGKGSGSGSASASRDLLTDVSTTTPTPGAFPSEPSVPAARVPVDSDGIRWTMVSSPQLQTLDAPDGAGGTIAGKVWSAAEPGADNAELAMTLDVGSRPYSLEGGLRGAVANTGGEVVDGPSPVTIAGREGLMVVATAHVGGIDGYMRMGAVKVGGRVYLAAYINGTSDIADGQQGFADLVASVQAP